MSRGTVSLFPSFLLKVPEVRFLLKTQIWWEVASSGCPSCPSQMSILNSCFPAFLCKLKSNSAVSFFLYSFYLGNCKKMPTGNARKPKIVHAREVSSGNLARGARNWGAKIVCCQRVCENNFPLPWLWKGDLSEQKLFIPVSSSDAQKCRVMVS